MLPPLNINKIQKRAGYPMKYKNLTLKKQIGIAFILFTSITLIIGLSYHIVLTQILQRKENIYMDNMITHVKQKIISSTNDIKSYAELIAYSKYTALMITETDPSKVLYYNQILTEMISNTIITNESINSISIVDTNDNIFGFVSKNFSLFNMLNNKYNAFDKNTHLRGFSGLLYSDLDNRYYYSYFMPIYNNNPASKINDKIGTCVVLSKTADLDIIVNNTTTTPNSYFMIVNSHNEVLASSNSNISENTTIAQKISSFVKEGAEGQYTETFMGKKSIIQYKTIEQTDWKIISIVPLTEINSDLNRQFIYELIFIILVIAVFFVLGVQFIISITNPIAKMADFMNKGAYHNLHNRLNITEQNEIGQLTYHINYMLDEIQAMAKKSIQNQSNMYEMELAKKRAELSALQSQINPHFLYNTLDCIKGYGYQLNSSEIVEIASSMAAIMRYSIKGPDIVEVSKEINCIKNYLNIISIRFSNRFKFTIQIDEEIYKLYFPRFILQPIVENAIYHGLEPKLTDGILSIHGYKSNSEIIFIIKDNGAGIPSDKLEILKQDIINTDPNNAINTYNERSIGLLNINSRVQFLYGKDYGLNIESIEKEGTTIIVKIPFQ